MESRMKQLVTQRVELVKEQLIQRKAWAWVFPSADPHMSEYLADHWQIRAWVSGFQGSAGTAVVLADGTAALWTDGRYFLEAEEALAETPFVLMKDGLPETPVLGAWIKQTAKAAGFGVSGPLDAQGQKLLEPAKPLVIADSLSLSPAMVDQFQLENLELVDNLVDQVWTDRPPMPGNEVRLFDEQRAGLTRQDKLAAQAANLLKRESDGMLVSALDELAWVLNLRGSDVECNPVFYGYLIISSGQVKTSAGPGENQGQVFRSRSQSYRFEDNPEDDPVLQGVSGNLNNHHLFVDPQKIPSEVRQALSWANVEIHPYDQLAAWVQGPAKGMKILYSPKQVSAGLARRLKDRAGGVLEADVPVTLAKSKKTSSELSSWRKCMVEDGKALVKFLYWLDQELQGEKVYTEAQLSQKLKGFRAEIPDFRGESFASIVGFRGNGAIIHYRPGDPGSAGVKGRGLLLIDSGGQYDSGTTDITRTFILGEPEPREVELYTRVLQGHISLSTVIFPKGTVGSQLDVLARKPLWDVALNYGHGTGHGVGFALNVHEGPGRISPVPNTVVLEPGMVFSNEPGYYETGNFGIRIENLVAVREEDRGFLGFETLTPFPYEPRLIDVNLLNSDEILWINNYHAWVRECLAPGLRDEQLRWLQDKTKPLV